MKVGPIHHHISDPLLLEYAAGSLDEGWSLAVATHLAVCPHCRQRLRFIEDAGGALIEDLEPETPRVDEDASWASLLSRLNAAQPEPAEVAAPEEKPAIAPGTQVPEPLRSYIGGPLESVHWRRLGIGAYHSLLETSDSHIRVRLLRVGAGKPLPEHSHGGRELTLVLRGSFVSQGEVFAPGDFEEEDENTSHRPVVTPDGDCICLIATDAPLRFQSRFMRMIQPLLGI